MSMQDINKIPREKWLTATQILEILNSKGLEINYKNVSRFLLKGYKCGWINRKNIPQYGHIQYIYRRTD